MLNSKLEKDIILFCKDGKTVKETIDEFSDETIDVEQFIFNNSKGVDRLFWNGDNDIMNFRLAGVKYKSTDKGIIQAKKYKLKEDEKSWICREYKWITGTILVLIGLVIAYLKIPS